MFNRTAASEVNERLLAVEIDGQKLTDFSPEEKTAGPPFQVASTFHKFALDLIKLASGSPIIISEEEQKTFIESALKDCLKQSRRKTSPREYQEILNLVSSFITRASQKYPGPRQYPQLQEAVTKHCEQHQQDSAYAKNIFIHQIALQIYHRYLFSLSYPKIDFNLLMSHATDLLNSAVNPTVVERVARLKYLMIDEYQDFSYLFYALTSAIRKYTPSVHLFAVGDDWQAINRFAGSDVDYFTNFAKYFTDDTINIPLSTNYRSCYRIVEYANQFMLKNYNPQAIPATAFNRQAGKIRYLSQKRIKLDLSDLEEDGRSDGRYFTALRNAIMTSNFASQKFRSLPPKKLAPAAKLLKTTIRLFAKHPYSEIMLLHRHNFLSCEGLPLTIFFSALRQLVVTENIMLENDFVKHVRCMTMHKSKGLESEIVILLEMDQDIVRSHHPHSTIFEIFGDNLAAEKADQERLLYVALTRAKQKLYLIGNDKNPLV